MTSLSLTYRVPEIPDPTYTPYQVLTDGDVRGAISGHWRSLVRAVGMYPPDSLHIAIRMLYSPSPEEGKNIQSRLSLLVEISSTDRATLESFRLLVEHGPLRRFYDFERCDPQETETEEAYPARCEIVRRADLIEPLHGPEFNDRIPRSYYSLQSFEADEGNDYLALDSVLDQVKEKVSIRLDISPADLTPELKFHTHYLARLQKVNRTWDDDELISDWPSELMTVDESETWSNRSVQRVKPLRYQDPMADEVHRSQQRFHEKLQRPNLLFRFEVKAQTDGAALLLATVMSEAAFEKGSYRILRTGFEREQPELDRHYPEFKRLVNLATVEELQGVFRLPMGSYSSPRCLRKNTDPPLTTLEDAIILGVDQELAAGQDDRGLALAQMGISISSLVKHLFLSGMTGFGKTTATLNILIQLHDQGIPFIVLEPAKTEYRILKALRQNDAPGVQRLAEVLQVYSLGKDSISPFRLNPLESCAGIDRDEHAGSVLACFMGAFPMLPPLPPILLEALERIYERHDPVLDPPLITDLALTARHVLLGKGYSEETTSDFLAALDVRLGSLTLGGLGRIFQSRSSVPPVREMISVPTLIEMDFLSPENAALLTMFLLMAIREQLITQDWTGRSPRLVIVIEEAHNLVGRSDPARPSEVAADPKAFAAEAICRMLVEFRAMGVGVIILDQHPTVVAPAVIKSTNTKIAFRQVSEDDRRDLGASMVFGPIEMEEIARLKTGEAYIYTEGLHGPRRIRTTNLHQKMDFSAKVGRERILPFIRSDSWFIEAARERAASELTQLKAAMDDYDRSWRGVAVVISSLLDRHTEIESAETSHRPSLLSDLHRRAIECQKRLTTQMRKLKRGSYHPFILEATGVDLLDEPTADFRNSLIDRFQKVIEPGFAESNKILGDLIDRLESERKEVGNAR